MSVAKLINRSSHNVTGKLKVTELFFEVPQDYANPSRGTIRLFARSVVNQEKSIIPPSEAEQKEKNQKPWFLYLQGGPGFGCQPPQSMGLTKHVLDQGYQLLYLDQRGTGLSSPITAATLSLQGDTQKQAAYLRLFRADSIVKDCEAIRKTLTNDYPEEKKKWSVFGQSFGGFCSFTYLSKSPEGLREVFTSGGVPPMECSAEEVYQATSKLVIRRNEAFYKKFPSDIEHIHKIAQHISTKGDIVLPSGGNLTVPWFFSIGILLGGAGGIDLIHNVILKMRVDLETFGFLTRPTLSGFEAITGGFDNAIIYAILHESIYCSGAGQVSGWAADRVVKALPQFPWLSTDSYPANVDVTKPLFFSGEMVFQSTFAAHPELSSLKEVADILASYSEWPELYDAAQLARNEVPVYCATFVDDMYVDYQLVNKTLEKVANVKSFITNTMYHGAIRTNTDELLKNLWALKEDPLE